MRKLPITVCTILMAVAISGCSNYQQQKNKDGKIAGIQMIDVRKAKPISYGPLFARIDVISGRPEFRIWKMEQSGNIRTGVWESTPGKWHFKNVDNHWEYCRIIEGESIITEDGGEPITVKAGDSFILHEGFSGTWEAVTTTRKDYVIRD